MYHRFYGKRQFFLNLTLLVTFDLYACAKIVLADWKNVEFRPGKNQQKCSCDSLRVEPVTFRLRTGCSVWKGGTLLVKNHSNWPFKIFAEANFADFQNCLIFRLSRCFSNGFLHSTTLMWLHRDESSENNASQTFFLSVSPRQGRRVSSWNDSCVVKIYLQLK